MLWPSSLRISAKAENEVNFLEKQIDGLLEKKQKANDRFTMLKKCVLRRCDGGAPALLF